MNMRESSNLEILALKKYYPELYEIHEGMRRLLRSIKSCTSINQIDLFAKDVNMPYKTLTKLESQSSNDWTRKSLISSLREKSILLQKFYDTTVNSLYQTRFLTW